jgi:hypothetical protein
MLRAEGMNLDVGKKGNIEIVQFKKIYMKDNIRKYCLGKIYCERIKLKKISNNQFHKKNPKIYFGKLPANARFKIFTIASNKFL